MEEQTEKLERFTSGIELLQKWGLKISEGDESEKPGNRTMQWR